MKAKTPILSLFALLNLFLLSSAYKNFMDESSIVYTYNRLAEIEKHCDPFLSSASKLNPDGNINYILRDELSFFNGDWDQQNGGSPLMPFDHSDLPSNSLPRTPPLKLVSFQVKDIKSIHYFKSASVSVGGILSIAISTDTSHYPTLQHPCFYMSPGFSILTVVFEGVYFESEENGGEKVMCMLGNTVLPLSEPPFEKADSLQKDDQILLVLRYPQTFNLTTRAIKGEIKSLNERGSLKYFDNVYISSQLGRFSKYQFSSELKSRVSDLYSYQEGLAENGVITFNGFEFCRIFRSNSIEPFHILPNYKFSDTLGPFNPGKETTSAKWKNEDFRLFFQNVRCQEETSNHNTINAKVSAVLRAFPATTSSETERERTGISGVTLFAEGTWDSSGGQLFMIGCSSIADSGLEGCNSQISLYFPRVYSIKQRSFMLGSISRIAYDEADLFFPLLFDYVPRPINLHISLRSCSSSYPSYNYSKIEMAASTRKRNQSPKAFAFLKRSFLKYPALEDGDVVSQLNLLSVNLNVNAYAICRQSSNKNLNSKFFIYMEVLSLGPLFGPYSPAGTENLTIANSQLLSISLLLMINEGPSVISTQCYRDISSLFLEGVYDPLVGDMNLIGCRKVSVEPGLDCSIEAKVQYASETLRWLKNPSVQITITSQRNEETDPLHFKTTTLQTYIVPYIKYHEHVAFRKLSERVLRFLISSVRVGIILSQLSYMNKNVDSIPYISLLMLAQQILGYIAELLINTGILFESKESMSHRLLSNGLHEQKLLLKYLEIPARILVLAALLLTVRLYQKVSEARRRPNAWDNVLFKSSKIYIALCFLLVQDFFLLPQVLENSLRKTRVKKPLRKMYYGGLTLLRLILFLYDYVRDPVLDPYANNDDFYEAGSVYFFVSGIGSIGFPVIMIVLAIKVHVQQSKNNLKSSRR